MKELLNCTQWSDWNPVAHFLDTAELMHTVGVGYDSMYAIMSDSERKIVAGGLANLGLSAYIDGVNSKAWWVDTTYNWGGVCNGGTIVGALAVLDDAEHGELAQKALALARQNIEHSMTGYGPDGLWREGCMYEDYQTRYIIAAVNALETAQGTDGGLSSAPGYNLTCESTIHCSATATKLLFDWSDSHESAEHHSNLFELGQRFNRPACPQFARIMSPADPSIDAEHSSEAPLGTSVNSASRMLLYYTSLGSQSDIDVLPRDQNYAYGVLTARRSWNFSNVAHSHQAYFGIKAGNNRENHGHLDLGSVIYDSAGHRFIHDLGADSYALPGYFSPDQRWTYYRLGSWGHNTLTFDGKNQHKDGTAAIAESLAQADFAYGIVNLTAAYVGHHPTSIVRGGALAGDRKSMVIRDEISWQSQSSAPGNMSIRFHTFETVAEQCYKGDGQATVDPHVCLTYVIPGDERKINVYARIVSESTDCPGAKWATDEVRLPKPQESTDGLTRISVVADSQDAVYSCHHVSVVIGPETPDTPLKVPALASWGTAGPLDGA